MDEGTPATSAAFGSPIGVSASAIRELVAARRSVRAFRADPPPLDLVLDALMQAGWAPSGSNMQPWHAHVVMGHAIADLKALMLERLADAPQGEGTGFHYPRELKAPYAQRRFRNGEELYALLGLAREDRAGRKRQLYRNYDFFGAGMGVFLYIDRQMGPHFWIDVGAFLQTFLLVLKANGVDSCAQGAWAFYGPSVSRFLGADRAHTLLCGISVGYADPSAPENGLVPQRAATSEYVRIHGG
ncbi:nitroreductase [Phenylobacterium sp.]|uniref:nitroreductase n=1 Tax=Phenylobacterium sp. TaxID=1871053 RepID=UPI0035B16AEF